MGLPQANAAEASSNVGKGSEASVTVQTCYREEHMTCVTFVLISQACSYAAE